MKKAKRVDELEKLFEAKGQIDQNDLDKKIRWNKGVKTDRQLIYLIKQLYEKDFVNFPEWMNIIVQHFCYFDASTASHKPYTYKYLEDQINQMQEKNNPADKGKPKAKHAKEIDDLLSITDSIEE